jgi:3-oxoacyl-[acyl-carrier-protein] synthase II
MNYTSEPVVITGMGVLACNGIGREAFWDALAAGRSGIAPITSFDASEYSCRIGGELKGFDPADYMKASVVRNWHRHVHQSVAAARLAVEDAELSGAGYLAERMAVSIGTSVGSPDEAYQGHVEAFESGGFRAISKYASSAFSGHAATVHVSIDIGLRGPAMTISSGCSTGLDVLTWGADQLRMGRADCALVGATESPLFRMSVAGGCALGVLSTNNDEPERAMRPFSGDSSGIVLSEGAVVLVLERLGAARARGARIFAEVAGSGSAAEARNPLTLERSGEALARAATHAMASAGALPQDIDFIAAHGVSLKLYDRSETNAYKRALGAHAYRVPVSAAKSMVGQPYSVGGLMGVGSALLALEKGLVSPTINLEHSDAECDLDYVPHDARRNVVKTALVCSMCFGGTHSAAVLRSLN